MSSGNSRDERRSFWLEHVRACEAGGTSVVAYARAHGVNARGLYRWRSRFRREDAHSAVAGRWVRTVAPRPRPAMVRVNLPNGVSVDLAGLGDESELSVVLRAAAAL